MKTCGHHDQVIVVMTIHCEKENYLLQLCNSEDFVKLEGQLYCSHYSHVVNVQIIRPE